MTAFWTAIRAALGVDELILVLALVLTTAGLWSWLGPGALTVPGVVLIWVGLPVRRPFVGRPGAETEAPKRRTG
jgi:hypothetical protein